VEVWQVYGRELTALVLGDALTSSESALTLRVRDDDDDDDREDDDSDVSGRRKEIIPFGDNAQARLVSVKCHKHREKGSLGLLEDDRRRR
jgi:hypothetical protein